MSDNSFSIIIPAFNEGRNLEPTINGAIQAISDTIKDYEIIIINDGSIDETGKVADRLAKKYKRIKVIHHKHNKGFGDTFREGLWNAKNKFIIHFPGDNDTSPISLRNVLLQAEKADLISTYTIEEKRSLPRRIVSKLFIFFMNSLFGLRLKYINGIFLSRTGLMTGLNLKSKGLAILSEAKVRLIKRNHSYIELPFEHIGRKHGQSTAISFKSAINTLDSVLTLFWDIYILKKP